MEKIGICECGHFKDKHSGEDMGCDTAFHRDAFCPCKHYVEKW